MARILYFVYWILITLHDWIHYLLHWIEDLGLEIGDPFRVELIIIDQEDLDTWLGAENQEET